MHTGWDEGCLTMKRGEIAKISIAGYKGYGASGFPAWGYPAGSILYQVYLVALLTIHTFIIVIEH